MDCESTRIVVVGGGISGLVLGHELRRHDVSVQVLEKSSRPGGNIQTEHRQGFLCEWGPNGFPASDPAMTRLTQALGIEDEVVLASQAARLRWVVRDGRLRALPMTPGAFLKSDALRWSGRLRVLGEWACPARRESEEESVFEFCRRRLGQQAAEVLADALVTGVYAGDPQRLGVRWAFPRLYEMEMQHGGLFRALRAQRRERGQTIPGPRMTLASFAAGMETLPQTLARDLGPSLRLGVGVRRIARQPDGRWRVETTTEATFEAEHVVLACPSWVAGAILQEQDDRLAGELAALPSAPVAVVCLGFSEGAIQRVERGFGFLVPGREELGLLGTVFESWIFPGRAPEGFVLWRVLIGGARDPTALELDDAQLVTRALHGLERVLGPIAPPEMSLVLRHPRGIPQYVVGYGDKLSRIESRLRRYPGLVLCGNSYRGVAVHQCVQEAKELADRLAEKTIEATGAHT